ncbi:MAG: TlpA family protein disulfide reductase [Pyrinomonadaceae bacterium]|nr:TlpA family protein disulfide reductase [Pyrinomonadaceae bacterium]
MQGFQESYRTRRVATGIILSLSLLVAAACGNTPTLVSQQSGNTPSGQRVPQSQYPMPPSSASADSSQYGFTLLDGRRMKMADYKGKVLVLDFWATYCPPCREEIPQLIELQRRFGPQGLNIVGLNVGGPDDRPLVPEFVRSYRIQYALGYPDTELVNLYLGNNDTIPQTIVFDRQGRLVKHFIGYDNTLPAELEQAIQSAISTE